VFASAIFFLFGITPPAGSIWDFIFNTNSLNDVFPKILTSLWTSSSLFSNLFGALTSIVAGGAIAAGIYFNRDEPLYGGLGLLLFKMLGLYAIISNAGIPAGLEPLVLVFMGMFNILFIISFINWIRGKGE
jgi:hypothetical protein